MYQMARCGQFRGDFEGYHHFLIQNCGTTKCAVVLRRSVGPVGDIFGELTTRFHCGVFSVARVGRDCWLCSSSVLLGGA